MSVFIVSGQRGVKKPDCACEHSQTTSVWPKCHLPVNGHQETNPNPTPTDYLFQCVPNTSVCLHFQLNVSGLSSNLQNFQDKFWSELKSSLMSRVFSSEGTWDSALKSPSTLVERSSAKLVSLAEAKCPVSNRSWLYAHLS